MKVIIEIDDDDVEKIKRYISKNKSFSLSNFISIAIHNQLMLEKGGSEIAFLEKSFFKDSINLKKKTAKKEVANIEITVDEIKLKKKFPFWGTQNRYFCLKQITRDLGELIAEEKTSWISYEYGIGYISTNATKLRNQLEKLDKKLKRPRGNKLSAGFPTGEFKSINRYEKQFIGGIDGKGNPYGMAVLMGFVSIKKDANKSYLGISKRGLNFSLLNSPIFDTGSSSLFSNAPPLSKEEIEYILRTLTERIPAEIEFMTFTLSYIQDGKDTPEVGKDITFNFLNEKYPEIAKSKKGGKFSSSEAETMRAGVVSRLNELGMLYIEKQGLKSRYRLTEKGRNFLEKGGI